MGSGQRRAVKTVEDIHRVRAGLVSCRIKARRRVFSPSKSQKGTLAKRERGEIGAEELAQIEDREIEKVIRKQEDIGLKAVTDGEGVSTPEAVASCRQEYRVVA